MPIRIHGVNLPDQKRIEIALMALYGIGRSRSNEILQELGIDKNTKTKELTATEEQKLRDLIEKKYVLEGELRRDVQQNIRRMMEARTYKGGRHAKRLPVRGQRTKTNSRTVRGNVRKTAGSGRKSSSEKT